MTKQGQVDGTDKNKLAFYAGLIAEHGADAIVVTDVDGLVEWANKSFKNLSGFTLPEMIGKKPGDVLQGPDTDPKTVAAIRQALKDRRQIRTEILNYTKSGVPYWIELNITPIFDEKGKHTHFMSVERDVTKRKELEEQTKRGMALEEARKIERRNLSQSNEWLYAAKSTDELLKVVERSMKALIPEAHGQLFIYSNSRDMLELAISWPESAAETHIDADDCWALRRGRAYFYGAAALDLACNHHADDDTPSFCLPVIAHGETIGLLHLAFTEISLKDHTPDSIKALLQSQWELALICGEQISLAVANVRLRQELQDQSVRDQLTGLWNRRWFLDVATKELNRMKGRQRQMSLISIDVDHFKRFNDHHGHDAGDLVLRHVGEAMNTYFEGDLAACRIGGEEFVVICPDTDEVEAVRHANKFRDLVAETTVRYGGNQLPRITISAGVATHPRDGNTVLDLMKIADRALYAAKANGRDCVVSASGCEVGTQAIAAE